MLRALVAVDNAFLRTALSRALEALGHAPREVEDGAAALDVLRKAPVDVLLVDLDARLIGSAEVLRAKALIRAAAPVPVLWLAPSPPPRDAGCRIVVVDGVPTPDRLATALREAGTSTARRPPTAPLVLLAEDDEPLRHALSDELAARGLRVVGASDGEEAFQLLLESDACDAVLLDLQMPRLSGRELHERMRGYVRFRDIPVVVITAFDHMRVPAGVAAVHKKPLDVDALAATLRRVAARAPA